MDFLRWYTDEAFRSIQQEDEMLERTHTLNIDYYRSRLLSVNWSMTSNVADFASIALGSTQPAAERIYLGKDHCYQYYLRSVDEYLSVAASSVKSVDEHPYIVEMRSMDQKRSPFRYGFFLGSLVYTVENSAETVQPPEPRSTPFRIYLDVLSKSKDLWIVFDPIIEDELGEITKVGPKANPWEYLPSSQNGRRLFHALKILEAGQIGKIDPKRDFFEYLRGGPVHTVSVRPYGADSKEVEKAAAASMTNLPSRGGRPK